MGKGSIWRALAVGLGMSTAQVACSAAEETLSLKAFEDRFVAEAQRAYPDLKIERLGEGTLRVERPNGEGGQISLVRAHGVYEGNPEELPTIMGNLVANLAPPPKASPEKLLILVRPSSYGDGDEKRMSRELAGDLSLFVAVDTPTSYSMPPAKNLTSEVALAEEAVWARALANTRERLRVAAPRFEVGRPSEISGLDGLASSLMAVDAFWDSPQMTSQGPLVVAVFARDDLLLAPESDRKAVASLKRLINETRGDPNALTGELLVRRNGRWEVLR